MPSVVVFGSTGFVGAPLIKAIKQAHPDWPVTAFIRNGRRPEDVKKELGADSIVVGEFTEFDKIREVAREHDIAVNAGNSFTPEPISAIVAGLKARPGNKGKLLHISGGGNFIDHGTSGEYDPTSKVWDDGNEDDIRQVNESMFNGPSDVVALEADNNGDVETYVVCIPVTYGGAAVGAKSMGIGYSLITGNAKPLGYVPYVGDGSAVLSVMHILDAVPFLVKILELAAKGPAQDSVYSRWYNVETEKVTWKAVATELAKVFYRKGIFASPDPKSVDIDYAGKGEVRHLVAANMLNKGSRAKAMGFRPTQPSILVQMHDDLRDMEL